MSKVSPALRLPSFGGKMGAARRSRPSNATCRQKSARQSLLHRSLRLRGPRTGQNEAAPNRGTQKAQTETEKAQKELFFCAFCGPYCAFCGHVANMSKASNSPFRIAGVPLKPSQPEIIVA